MANSEEHRSMIQQSQECGPVSLDPAVGRAQTQQLVDRLLLTYLVLIIALTAWALLIVGVRRYILHSPYPGNTLLFSTATNRFSDFTDLSVRVAHFGETDMLSRTDFPTPFGYPVACVYAFLIFVRLFPNPLAAYLGFMLASFIAVAYGFARHLRSLRGPRKLHQAVVWITLFTSFPALFLLDRGNIEGVVWLLIVFGTVAFVRGRMAIASLLLATAAAMKLFPVVFFALFLAKKRYKEFFIAIAETALIMGVALAGIGPTFKQALHDSSLSVPFLNNYIVKLRLEEAGFDHSLWGALKQLAFEVLPNDTNINSALPVAFKVYICVLITVGLLLYWFHIRRLPVLNQFIIFVLLCDLTPFVSYEYHLIQVYVAWAAFVIFLLQDVAEGAVHIPVWMLLACLTSFAVLFTPQSYLLIGSRGFGGQIKTVALLAVLAISMTSRMHSTLFQDICGRPPVSG